MSRDGDCATWFDIMDVQGRRIPASVLDGMRLANEVVVLLTPAALSSDWVRHELGSADYAEHRVTLILYGVSPDHLPDPWRAFARMDIDEVDGYVVQARRRAEVGS